jgi:hypothetical protein
MAHVVHHVAHLVLGVGCALGGRTGRRMDRVVDRRGCRSRGGRRGHRSWRGLAVMSVILVAGGDGSRSRRSPVVTLAQMIRHHLAAAMVAALHDALADVIQGDLLPVEMNGGALGDEVDLGMMYAGELVTAPYALGAQNGEEPAISTTAVFIDFPGWCSLSDASAHGASHAMARASAF